MGLSKRRFDEIFTKGKRVQGRFSRISALPGSGDVGFATAKKLGNRPRRNRVRRRFQSAYRESSLSTSLDLVVVVGAKAADVEFAEIREEMKSLLIGIESRWASESESS